MKGRRRVLDCQADAIEDVLSRHHVPAKVTGGAVMPDFIRFVLAPGPGVTTDQVAALADELALALHQREVHVVYENQLLQVKVPCEGVAPERQPDDEPLPPEVANILAAGATRAGKNSLVSTIRTVLAIYNSRHTIKLSSSEPE